MLGKEGIRKGTVMVEGSRVTERTVMMRSLLNLDVHLGPSGPLGLTPGTLTEWPVTKTRSN